MKKCDASAFAASVDERREEPEERGKPEGRAHNKTDRDIFHIWEDGMRWVIFI